MVKINATIKNIGSSKIETLKNLTQRVMIGNKINGGSIILESNDPTTIRL